MLKLSFSLVYVFWRKFFIKGDFLAISLLVGGISFILAGIYQAYEQNAWFLFAFLSIFFFHQLDRRDISLLKNNPKWRWAIVLEYLINNTPVFLIFCLKKDFLYALLYAFLLVLCTFIPKKSLKIPYPFRAFDPLWQNTFRKYKLLFCIPISLFLILIGKWYHNENLALFALFLVAFISSFPYFEREHLVHLTSSAFLGKSYLHEQIKTAFFNYFVVSLPANVIFAIFFPWELLFYIPLGFLIPLTALLTKYTLFGDIFLQNMLFVLIVSGIFYAVPLFVLPILYYVSIEKINRLQDVTH